MILIKFYKRKAEREIGWRYRKGGRESERRGEKDKYRTSGEKDNEQ